ncbi:MAG: helix-turn-helix transcriptional regulator [Pseudomonadota bacterium]
MANTLKTDMAPPEPAEDTIGARIRQARKELGLSQGDLAARLGVSQPTVANWESNVHNPRQLMLAKIGDALEASLGWLAGGNAVERLTPDHPAAAYLSRTVIHVPVLPLHSLTDRQSLQSRSTQCAAIDYVPVSTETTSLFGVFTPAGIHADNFPGEPLFIFDYNRAAPIADAYALILTLEGPRLHQWSTALMESDGGEVLGTLTAAIRYF